VSQIPTEMFRLLYSHSRSSSLFHDLLCLFNVVIHHIICSFERLTPFDKHGCLQVVFVG